MVGEGEAYDIPLSNKNVVGSRGTTGVRCERRSTRLGSPSWGGFVVSIRGEASATSVLGASIPSSKVASTSLGCAVIIASLAKGAATPMEVETGFGGYRRDYRYVAFGEYK